VAEAEALAPGAFFAVTSNVDAHLARAGFTPWEVRQFTVHVGQFTVHVGQFTVHVGQFTVRVAQFTVYVGQFTIHVGRFTGRFTGHMAQFTVQVREVHGNAETWQCARPCSARHWPLPNGIRFNVNKDTMLAKAR
jgi:hypothetical protein